MLGPSHLSPMYPTDHDTTQLRRQKELVVRMKSAISSVQNQSLDVDSRVEEVVNDIANIVEAELLQKITAQDKKIEELQQAIRNLTPRT